MSVTSQKKVLITGATGALGPTVASAFAEAGFHIRTISRSAPQCELLPENAEFFSGDITARSTLEPALAGVQVVVHLAGLLHILNPTSALRSEYERINVVGTTNVVTAALQAGVERIVLSSTIAVYGDSQGKNLDEESTPRPQTPYGKTKLSAEQVVLNAQSLNGLSIGSVLRLAAVYGPRLRGNYRRLLTALAGGRFIPLGKGLNRRTLVYDKDVARAMVLAATHSHAGGRIYNVTDGEVHTLKKIIATICESLGRRPPRMSVPLAPASAVISALENSARLIGRPLPIGRGTIEKYTEDIAVSGDRIQTELGFEPQFDLGAGWKDTVEQMRRSGELLPT